MNVVHYNIFLTLLISVTLWLFNQEYADISVIFGLFFLLHIFKICSSLYWHTCYLYWLIGANQPSKSSARKALCLHVMFCLLKKHFSGLEMQNQNVGRFTRKQFKTPKVKQLQAKMSQHLVL